MSVNAKKDLEGVSITKFRNSSRQIADQVREQVQKGDLSSGTQLPTAMELAIQWQVSTFTVHQAMTILVEEGLLIRRRGAGTFVADRQNKLETVALYYGKDFFENSGALTYYHRLNRFLCKKLSAINLKNQIIIDSHFEEKRNDLSGALQRAVDRNEVQAIICPMVSLAEIRLVQGLPVPAAFLTNLKMNSVVYYDFLQFFEKAFETLEKAGCKDVGVIAATSSSDEDSSHEPFLGYFLEQARQRKFRIKNEWIQVPRKYLAPDRMEHAGYEAFRKIWRQKQRPTGLIVYPDIMARGVILALSEQNVSVPEDLRLILHRNEGINFPCPHPATWLVTQVSAVAEKLIKVLQSQATGTLMDRVLVPFEVTEWSEL